MAMITTYRCKQGEGKKLFGVVVNHAACGWSRSKDRMENSLLRQNQFEDICVLGWRWLLLTVAASQTFLDNEKDDLVRKTPVQPLLLGGALFSVRVSIFVIIGFIFKIIYDLLKFLYILVVKYVLKKY